MMKWRDLKSKKLKERYKLLYFGMDRTGDGGMNSDKSRF